MFRRGEDENSRVASQGVFLGFRNGIRDIVHLSLRGGVCADYVMLRWARVLATDVCATSQVRPLGNSSCSLSTISNGTPKQTSSCFASTTLHGALLSSIVSPSQFFSLVRPHRPIPSIALLVPIRRSSPVRSCVPTHLTWPNLLPGTGQEKFSQLVSDAAISLFLSSSSPHNFSCSPRDHYDLSSHHSDPRHLSDQPLPLGCPPLSLSPPTL